MIAFAKTACLFAAIGLPLMFSYTLSNIKAYSNAIYKQPLPHFISACFNVVPKSECANTRPPAQ
jgi:hypothetical protein